MTHFKYLLILGFFYLAGCGGAESSNSPVAKTTSSPERPSSDAIILSRSLPFQNDSRISYCEVLSSDNKSYSGYRDQVRHPLASLSKVVTTAWALRKLGPDFRFESQWYLKPVDSKAGLYDAYLKTKFDPVFNIDKVLYSLSLLREQGVTGIRNLVIDESTRVYLSALALPHVELENVPVSSNESAQNLKIILNSENWSVQTQSSKDKLQAWAQENSKTLNIPNSFSVQQIEIKNSREINLTDYSKKISFRSAPLLRYLKNLNVYSNNYVTDALFSYMGGLQAFKDFQSEELKISNDALQFFSGSGLAVTVDGQRKDNSGSCFSILKILSYMQSLSADDGLNLGHVLYNPSLDLDGTFESKLNFHNQVVFKTGRLFENPALNLAGIVSTEKGFLYFAFLGHKFSDTEADEIEKSRDAVLTSTLNFYKTTGPFLTLKEYHILID